MLRARVLRQFSTSSARFLDPYKVLGVARDASDKEIKKQYYSLAKKFHPDINKSGDADNKFQEIQNSYEMLNTKEKRQKYDMYGDTSSGSASSGYPGGGGSPFGQSYGNPFGGQSYGNPFSNFNFEDLFTNFSGQSSQPKQPRMYEGASLEVLVQLTLEDIALRSPKTVKYTRVDECSTCKGSGLKPGMQPKTCGACHGEGHIAQNIQGFMVQQECSDCQGTGEKVPKSCACTKCGGKAVETNTINLEVQIPIGVQNGTRMVKRGLGDSPECAKTKFTTTRKGDLYVKFHILPHKQFTILPNKIDLEHKTQISVTTACLGGIITIPTLLGPHIRVSVPAGTQFNEQIQIPDQGLPTPHGRGSLIVKLEVITSKPKTVTEQMLLEALALEIGDKSAKIKTLNRDTDAAPGTAAGADNKSSTDTHQDKNIFKRLLDKFTSDK